MLPSKSNKKGLPLAREAFESCVSELLLYNVDRLSALRALFDVKAYAVTLGKGLETAALDG